MKKFVGFIFVGVVIIITLIASGHLCAVERPYPNQQISLVIPGDPGSVTDLISRFLIELLSPSLGQPIVANNKPGGGMLIGGNVVVTSKPDGYTIGMLMIPTAIPEVYRYFRTPPYSSTDLKPICRVANFLGVMIVKSDAPWNTLKDVIEYARKNPGMKFAIGGKGGSPHQLMLTIAKKENIHFTEVPHSSDSDQLMQVLGAHIPITIVAYPTAKAQIQAESVKVLTVYASKRFQLLPRVPTVVELGYVPGHYPAIGLFAPKDTPDSIVKKIDEKVKDVCNVASFRQRLENLGFEVDYENADQYQESLKRYKADIYSHLKELGFVKE